MTSRKGVYKRAEHFFTLDIMFFKLIVPAFPKLMVKGLVGYDGRIYYYASSLGRMMKQSHFSRNEFLQLKDVVGRNLKLSNKIKSFHVIEHHSAMNVLQNSREEKCRELAAMLADGRKVSARYLSSMRRRTYPFFAPIKHQWVPKIEIVPVSPEYQKYSVWLAGYQASVLSSIYNKTDLDSLGFLRYMNYADREVERPLSPLLNEQDFDFLKDDLGDLDLDSIIGNE